MNIFSQITQPNGIPRTLAQRLRARLRELKPGSGNKGFCPICEKPVFFKIDGPWLRDQYHCTQCGSIPRWRALMQVLGDLYPSWRQQSIHESSPGGALSDKLRRECCNYLPTHFFPEGVLGSQINGFRCEDLARQTFRDESFDLVVTSDVLEHLPEARQSMAEVARTLKPGGAHIFTVPWYFWQETLVRAKLVDGRIEHIEPPDYHGNPIDDKGSLVITEWGRELPFLLTEWNGLPTSVFRLVDRRLGIDGKFLEVFVSKKGSA